VHVSSFPGTTSQVPEYAGFVKHLQGKGRLFSATWARVVGITLAVVILVLLCQPESNAYYASRDRP